jgi:hypothetical protein
MKLGWGRQERHPEFWWRNLLKSVHLENQEGDRRIILKWVLRKWVVRIRFMEPILPFLYISDQLSMAFCWCNCINEIYSELILSAEEV